MNYDLVQDAGAPVEWNTLPDAEAVAAEATRLMREAADRAIGMRGRFRLVLAGGRTPQRAYELLATGDADWDDWELFFGDERCLPPDHPERNSRAAYERWLERVPIPARNLHPIPAELGPVEAASAYAEEVRRAMPFDMVLLGMGEDGHTASLFPGHAEPQGQLVLAVEGAPKPPPGRVSLSSEALCAAEQVLIVVTGAGKRAAVARWRAGEALPVSRIRGRRITRVLLDLAADGG